MNRTFDELEIEGKRLLTEQEFIKVRTYLHFSVDDFHIQHNHYFDTSDFQLKEQNTALRIRQKNDDNVLTLKVRSDQGVLEKHQSIADDEWFDGFDGIPLSRLSKGGAVQTYLENEWGIDIHTLRHLGRLSTWRAERSYENGIFALDESHYFDVIDHELEFEGASHEHVSDVLARVADHIGLDKQAPEPPPKIQRFFTAAIGR